MKIDAIDWNGALQSASTGGTARLTGSEVAEMKSLSALFMVDFSKAVARIIQARSIDPFNPIHNVRLALLIMRFGDWKTAAEITHSLAESAPDSAISGYLWGLATLRGDETKRAANIAQDVSTSHASFALSRFLRAEALIKTQLKGIRKHLSDLPRGEPHAATWADLLIKMLMSGSDDVAKLAKPMVQDPSILPTNSRPAELATLVVALVNEPIEQLIERLEKAHLGSRAEEIILLAIHDRLQEGEPKVAAAHLRQLLVRFPQRTAVRRLYVSVLTRLAVSEAVAKRYSDAVRLVEVCKQLEPHETAHYQNLAALFTLMREPDAYHEAWFELNRHEYRLALLGKISPSDGVRLAKSHRLFAQQARLNHQSIGGIQSDSGIFAEKIVRSENESTKYLALNHEKLAGDPDLIRQWVHHQRAELIFNHLALGFDPRRFLLNPENPRVARSRLAGLSRTAGSLAVLVPIEGKLLADRITQSWTQSIKRVASVYAPPEDDTEVKSLQAQYLGMLGDLTILCNDWLPDGKQPDSVEEVLEFLFAIAPFFDEKVLTATVKESKGQSSWPIGRFRGFINRLFSLDGESNRTLTQEERTRVINSLAAELLTQMAYRTRAAHAENANRIALALTYVERARKLEPENLSVLITAAQFYLWGTYFREAEEMLARAQRSTQFKSEDQIEGINSLIKHLEELRKSGEKGIQRNESLDQINPILTSAEELATLEKEIERHPTAIQNYEELVRQLVINGRFIEAQEWCAMAIRRCSAREAQLRARSLDLDARGLEFLGSRDQNAVRLYIGGVHRPTIEIINGIPNNDNRPYPLLYVLGQCYLAVHEPEKAQKAFAAAHAACSRSSHRVVLRRLSADVDKAYLAITRQVIQQKIADSAFEDAMILTGQMISRLRRPEVSLIDLVRVHVAASFARIGNKDDPLPRPAGAEIESAKAAIVKAYDKSTDRERARCLAEIGLQIDPESKQKFEDILRRLNTLDEQSEIVSLLAKSGEYLRHGQLADALNVLEVESSTAGDSRILRQRTLILLKLERFEEADRVVAEICKLDTPVKSELVSTYPRLVFHQRIAASARLIRTGLEAEALEMLAGATPTSSEEKVELAYCRGFCIAMSGYRLRREGRKLESRRALVKALSEVEQFLQVARSLNHVRLIKLYDELESDPELASIGELL